MSTAPPGLSKGPHIDNTRTIVHTSLAVSHLCRGRAGRGLGRPAAEPPGAHAAALWAQGAGKAASMAEVSEKKLLKVLVRQRDQIIDATATGWVVGGGGLRPASSRSACASGYPRRSGGGLVTGSSKPAGAAAGTCRTLTLKGLRRLLEEELQVAEGTLDAHKGTIKKLLAQVPGEGARAVCRPPRTPRWTRPQPQQQRQNGLLPVRNVHEVQGP